MNITQLIEQLEYFRELMGDVEVYYEYDGGYDELPVRSLYVSEGALVLDCELTSSTDERMISDVGCPHEEMRDE